MMPPATAEEIAALVGELDRERRDWISGRFTPTPTGLMVQDDAMTLFGPFGGEAVTPSPMQAKVAARFHGGSGRCELVQAIAEGDLLVLVLIERNDVTFEDADAAQPWVLRTTQVFRRAGTRWRRLHRHADPLIDRRSFTDTLALAAGR